MFLSAARKRPVKKANLSLRYRCVSEKGNLLCPFFEDFFHAGIACDTLQNSPFVSSTREQSNRRSGTRLKTESETGEGLAPHALGVRLARFYATLYRFLY